jgi:hypothetical protein
LYIAEVFEKKPLLFPKEFSMGCFLKAVNSYMVQEVPFFSIFCRRGIPKVSPCKDFETRPSEMSFPAIVESGFHYFLGFSKQ